MGTDEKVVQFLKKTSFFIDNQPLSSREDKHKIYLHVSQNFGLDEKGVKYCCNFATSKVTFMQVLLFYLALNLESLLLTEHFVLHKVL